MKQIDLGGAWRFKSTEAQAWRGATVPGTVLAELLNHHVIADPNIADNEFAACAQTRQDWVFQRYFNLDAESLAQEQLFLHADGLMTLAKVFLNGQLLGESDNMHRSWDWNIKAIAKAESNNLEIHFASSLEYAEARQRETPTWSVNGVPGFQHIRQSHHTFGWDWGPVLPDMGIFRPISIRAWTGYRLEQFYVHQHHSADHVDLEIVIHIDQPSVAPVQTIAILSPPGATTPILARSSILPGQHSATIRLAVANPELWWPAGLGSQPLYDLEMAVADQSIDSSAISQLSENRRQSVKIGLRTLTVAQHPDKWGRSFAFSANGIEFFAMGSDYIPEDNVISRHNRAKTEQLLKDCVAANHNCIRVWGGGYFPDDYFYEICDQLGLVIWQDMLFACALYDFNPSFQSTIEVETIQNMRRLRHHTALGLWCGNNEMEQAIVEWGLNETPQQRADYIKMYEVFLPAIAQREDPDRFYWLASPSSFGSFDRPNSQDYGDMHDWSIWHGKAPFTDFRKRFPRFMSEFGLQSYPLAKTLAPCIPPAERNLFSYLMELREKHSNGVYPLLHYLQQYFRLPAGFENQLYVSHLMQAEGVRYGVEHWRRHRGRCMGAVIWQLNDCWPGISWSSIDYAGRWKALHYASKRFFSPILASVCETGSSAEIHVSNDTRSEFAGKLSWKLRGPKGTVLRKGSKRVSTLALSTQRYLDLDFSAELGATGTTAISSGLPLLPREPASRTSYLDYSLTNDQDQVISQGVCLFVPAKFFEFSAPRIKLSVESDAAGYAITLRSRELARFVEIDFNGFDAVLADNYFDLVPGQTRTIQINEFRGAQPANAEAVKAALSVKSLYDSWHHDKA